MAETLISPGVLARENDQSFVTSPPAERGAAIIGPAVIGPVEKPTLISSFSSYQAIFGGALQSGSGEFTYLTSIAANQYFQNGGNSLLVTRVTSGSFTSATSTTISNDVESGIISTDTNALLSSLTNVTGSAGTYNISGSSGTGTGFTGSITLTDGTTVSTITAASGGSGYVVGDIITVTSQSLGYGAGAVGTDTTITLNANDIVNNTAFTLETISEGEIMNSAGPTGSNGALTSGSTDNVRWEIAASNSASGVFSLLIRRGDDTNNNKVILESYNNISLDPFASNYISRAIGDVSSNLITEGADTFLQESGSFPNISNYVRVKSVNNPTPRYFNNDGSAKDQFTGSLPANWFWFIWWSCRF
jgi:hypothetical protein